MSYLVLARKYRPQSFDDLAGQDHVARTLANAIAQGRIAHAFLFTGVRGVGKTTSARLLAKCLNCVGQDGSLSGPTAKPCQVCAPCKEIAAGADIDVQEIDGASYNGVDEVRRLQEGLAFRPARDRYKIYIVDEVHMLSNAAWNAFLKTLEEPPPHVKFIFATTEVHKVPVTILSRCQRYDFKLIGAQTVAARLREVLSNESIEADGGAVAILAREAAGSMRDAMSLLDQVIAFSGNKLTESDVARVLGVADRKVLHDLARATIEGNAAAALEIAGNVASQGFDIAHVAKDLLRHFRNLVVARVCGEGAKELLDLPDEELADITALASQADPDDLVRLFQGFSRGLDDIVRSGQPRAAFEMALVRLARRPALLPLDELLARVGELERRLATGTPPPRSPSGGGASRGSSSVSSVSSTTSGQSPFLASSSPLDGSHSGPAWPVDAGERTRGSLALAPDVSRGIDPMPTPRQATVTPLPARPAPAVAATRSPSVVPRVGDKAFPSSGVGWAEASTASGPTEVVSKANLDAWRTILGRMHAERPLTAAIFERAVPLEIAPKSVLLGFDPESFEGNHATDPEALEFLRRHVRAELGPGTSVALDLSSNHSGDRGTVAAIDAQVRQEELSAARAAVANHPLVKKLITMFGAELREVRLPDGREE